MSPDEGGEGSAALARLLRQRMELGLPPLVLGSLGREEALRSLRRFRDEGTADPEGVNDDEVELRDPSTGEGEEPSSRERKVQTGEAGEEVVGELDYPTLRTVAEGCRRCRLAEERKQVVFSDGNPDGRLMVVGEAPGAREDETGLPFVGPAGKLLDLLLGAVDLSREDTVYICNVIKCRPPGNRDPLADEIESCAPYLRRQIELVAPEVILGVGTFAAQLLTGQNKALGRLRGKVYRYEEVPLVVTYHPAALLRNRGWTRPSWEDFQLLRQVMEGP